MIGRGLDHVGEYSAPLLFLAGLVTAVGLILDDGVMAAFGLLAVVGAVSAQFSALHMQLSKMWRAHAQHAYVEERLLALLHRSLELHGEATVAHQEQLEAIAALLRERPRE